MRTLIIAVLFLTTSISFAEPLEIESDPVFSSILKEMNDLGTTPEVYPLAENYRLDLTLMDLIDQTTELLRDHSIHNERLKNVLYQHGPFPDFLSWFKELKILAQENPEVKARLNLSLHLQFYAPSGVALLPAYKLVDIRKFKDRHRLQRIRTYNRYAGDPEGQGLLAVFAKKTWKGFYTGPLTVAKLRAINYSELKRVHAAYYARLIELYVKHDSSVTYWKSLKGIRAHNPGGHSFASLKLFNTIQELPSKHQVLFILSQKSKHLPTDSGFFILTPAFIEAHLEEINEGLRSLTLDQLLHSDDDQYLLSLRNFMFRQQTQIEKSLEAYNLSHTTELKLLWKDRNRKPGRLEAIANIDTLLLLYPDSPWFKDEHGIIIDRNGRQIFFNESVRGRIGRMFRGLRKNIFLSENYLSFLAGGVAFAVSDGNVPVAMTIRRLVKRAVMTSKYDHEWRDFLKDAPTEVLNSLLTSAGTTPGRFFKIVALGAGQGVIQSYLTGQNLRTGAMVGASLSIIQYYVLPTSWARPMTSGYDAKSLAMNRRLELFEGSIRGLIQGGAVAAIEGENITRGALKGMAFGFVSTQMVIWFLGTRYNPFKGWSDGEVDEMIALENDFQNSISRGGTYAIDRKLILDANFRVGGVLPRLIGYAVTLPGNVAMNDRGFESLSLLTHEASHLMQQHQSGVFGFYLFRYIPTYLRTGYFGHPDENFMYGVLN